MVKEKFYILTKANDTIAFFSMLTGGALIGLLIYTAIAKRVDLIPKVLLFAVTWIWWISPALRWFCSDRVVLWHTDATAKVEVYSGATLLPEAIYGSGEYQVELVVANDITIPISLKITYRNTDRDVQSFMLVRV